MATQAQKPDRLELAPHHPNGRTPWLCPALYAGQTYGALTAGGDSIELADCPVCGATGLRVETPVEVVER